MHSSPTNTVTMSDDYEDEGPVPDAVEVNAKSDQEYKTEVTQRGQEVTRMLNSYVGEASYDNTTLFFLFHFP